MTGEKNFSGGALENPPKFEGGEAVPPVYFHNFEAFEDWDAHVEALKAKLRGLSEKVTKALEIVKKYHDQPRMFTKGNYNRHPLRVARILAEELGVTEEISILIALCHDLGEWSEYDIENLKAEFGDDVYQGVKTLTWDQKGEWSDFVETILHSNIKNLVAIKVADKLDNNRASALTGTPEDRQKAKQKTMEVMMPVIEKYHPGMVGTYNEVLSRLK